MVDFDLCAVCLWRMRLSVRCWTHSDNVVRRLDDNTADDWNVRCKWHAKKRHHAGFPAQSPPSNRILRKLSRPRFLDGRTPEGTLVRTRSDAHRSDVHELIRAQRMHRVHATDYPCHLPLRHISLQAHSPAHRHCRAHATPASVLGSLHYDNLTTFAFVRE
jgi:hypothetical protein